MDQEPNASSGGLEVVEDLSHVSGTDCAAGLDLDDHLGVDHEIGEVLSDPGPVLVSDSLAAPISCCLPMNQFAAGSSGQFLPMPLIVLFIFGVFSVFGGDLFPS